MNGMREGVCQVVSEQHSRKREIKTAKVLEMEL